MSAEEYPNHGTAWHADEEKQLYDAFVVGRTVAECVAIHGRKSGGIVSRLKILGLLDEEGNIVSPAPEFAASAASQKREVKAEAAKQRRNARKAERDKFAPEMNARFNEALRLMEGTRENLFITGKAGTGKSTLLSYFCRTTDKQPVVLAPTGVAALNVKGQTIHRFFNFYVDVTAEKIRSKRKIRNPKLFKKLKTIVIDEISMVRADLLDCIDVFLRMHGPNPGVEFGGVQMVFVGDLYQLPPVVRNDERGVFSEHYETPYFFSAHVLRDTKLHIVELDKVYRQKDQDFVDLLNRIRDNSVDAADIKHINSRLSQAENKKDIHITLTTTNAVADNINQSHLVALKGKSYNSTAEIEGEVGQEYYPTAVDMNFKIGAQIMMLNNDGEGRWVNGSIGKVQAVEEDDEGSEYCVVELDDGETAQVYPFTWEVFKFGMDAGEITSAPTGSFRQYPFRLAWAVTIHKSQGKTFDRVVIDIGRGAFAAGQMYVALSRCRSFEGVTLKSPIRAQDIRTDPQIATFLAKRAPDYASAIDKLAMIRDAIAAKAILEITYLKADETETKNEVLPLRVGPATYQGLVYDGMKAYCVNDEVERMYRVDRIIKMQKVL